MDGKGGGGAIPQKCRLTWLRPWSNKRTNTVFDMKLLDYSYKTVEFLLKCMEINRKVQANKQTTAGLRFRSRCKFSVFIQSIWDEKKTYNVIFVLFFCRNEKKKN